MNINNPYLENITMTIKHKEKLIFKKSEDSIPINLRSKIIQVN